MTLFAAPPPPPVPADAPPLVLETFFQGRTIGRGHFTNAWTGARRAFEVTMEGSWDGRTLTLVEEFAFVDGERDRKTWRLRRTGEGSFVGTRDDMVGEARGWTDGNIVRLEYKLRIGGWTVTFFDALGLAADGTVRNDTEVGKWGMKIGRLHMTVRGLGRPTD